MSETEELAGTMNCPVCGVDAPHSHEPSELELERHARPAFEAWYPIFCKGNYAFVFRTDAWGIPRMFDRAMDGTTDYYADKRVEGLWRMFALAWLRKHPDPLHIVVNRFAR